jgi:hypothetical protein
VRYDLDNVLWTSWLRESGLIAGTPCGVTVTQEANGVASWTGIASGDNEYPMTWTFASFAYTEEKNDAIATAVRRFDAMLNERRRAVQPCA